MLGFLMILFVFVTAYGITSWAILYSDSDGRDVVDTCILLRPYFNMYGEFFLKELTGKFIFTNNVCYVETEQNLG